VLLIACKSETVGKPSGWTTGACRKRSGGLDRFWERHFLAGRFLALVWVIGGVGGVLGISGYLWITHCLGYHGNEAFAPLHHMDQKNFLRLHIDDGGALTVYPMGVDRVCRRWRFYP